MRYVIAFRDGGVPKTGLSPTIDIYIKVADGAGAGAPPAVAEFNGGFYYFDATPTERLALRLDSEDVTMEDAERYIFMEVGPNDDDLKWMKKIGANRWKIFGNQLIIYDDDDVTPLYTFNLKDSAGNPAMENVYERVPV